MNLDDYTSKYIDGELSASEDAEMRAYLSEHDEERAEFDHAALISVAMMHESDSIELPAGLFEKTDVLVLDSMKAFAQAQPIQHNKHRVRELSAVMAVALFFVVSQFYVTDNSSVFQQTADVAGVNTEQIEITNAQPNHGVGTSALQALPANPASVATLRLQHESVSTPPGLTHSGIIDQSRLLYAVAEATASSMQSSVPSSVQSTVAAAVSTNSTVISSDPVEKHTLVASTSLQFANAVSKLSRVRPAENAKDAVLVSSGSDVLGEARRAEHPAEAVQMTTFMGTIVRSSATASSSQHFSQSIGYRVTEQDNVGVEVGSFAMLSGLQEQFGTSGTTNTPGDGLHKGTLNGSDDPPELSKGFSDGGSTARLKNVETVQTHNILWGAAYFEHAFVRGSDLNLKARVAVGTTDGGPIVLARALSSVRIFGPLAFTLGTEGRMFFLDTKNVNSPEQTMQTMLSVVYGIQVKF